MKNGNSQVDIRVYLWIEGQTFSPKDFQSKLTPSLSGSIEYRKRFQNGIVEKTREHWKSSIFQVENHEMAIEKVHELVRDLRLAILAIKSPDTVVMAEVVSHCYDGSEAHGFYLPVETMMLLSEVGVSLDIDQYYHVEG